MSGLPKKNPGVWQSLQPATTTKYLPRSICDSACARGSSASAAPAAASAATAMIAEPRMSYLPSCTFVVVMSDVTRLATSVHSEGYTHAAGWQDDMRVAIAHFRQWAAAERLATTDPRRSVPAVTLR